MNPAEIKIDLFRKLDSLKGANLIEAYGLLLNHINGSNNLSDWDNLTFEQKDAIKLGLTQLDDGKGRSHTDVISDLRNRFINE
ncbi:MAG: hypothetical protein COB15_06865 [Flavobacteriales bacterium]|nr:MAG: hypothetical protein COB15_06865 [Flavobacteriales bacterium]